MGEIAPLGSAPPLAAPEVSVEPAPDDGPPADPDPDPGAGPPTVWPTADESPADVPPPVGEARPAPLPTVVSPPAPRDAGAVVPQAVTTLTATAPSIHRRSRTIERLVDL